MSSLHSKQITASFISLLLIFSISLLITACTKSELSTGFDTSLAYSYLEEQMKFGSRYPGSEGHEKTINYIQSELRHSGWLSETWQSGYKDMLITNIVAKRQFNADKPWIILCAHYDTRRYADRDPIATNQSQPVPGANDGASGVSVLLGLAAALPQDIPVNVWFVFFDAEDQGDINGWQWIVGSTHFVEQLTDFPDQAIIVDMIGDSDLNIYFEGNSNPALSNKLWKIASNLGFSNYFIPEPKYSMLDDHTPFLQAGIDAVDIIDFDYPYWHTTSDTLDKVSPESLYAVGAVLYEYLTHYDLYNEYY